MVSGTRRQFSIALKGGRPSIHVGKARDQCAKCVFEFKCKIKMKRSVLRVKKVEKCYMLLNNVFINHCKIKKVTGKVKGERELR